MNAYRNVSRLASALLFVGLAACTASGGDMGFDLAGLGTGDGGARCTAGDTKTCSCLGGGSGTQTCRVSGQSYGSCVGCGPEEEDGPLPTLNDAGSSLCGACDGCCNGTTCVPVADQTNAQCGQRGAACASCGSKVCDTGTGVCLDASGGCSPGTCPNGCCKVVGGQSSCQINQPTACGTGGGACVECAGGVLCDGTCTNTIDPNYSFKVYVKTLSMDSRNTGDSCWDEYVPLVGCNDFEPKVCFGYLSGGSILEGCTDSVPNVADTGTGGTVAVSWDDSTGLVRAAGQPILITGASFIAGGKVRIRAMEADFASSTDDEVASGYYTPVAKLTKPMSVGMYGHVKSITFELR